MQHTPNPRLFENWNDVISRGKYLHYETVIHVQKYILNILQDIWEGRDEM